ncbi:hypothetical protein [Deinococcus multiflagellatus]|uniref:Uncharacterized protein n=1 Tax=Deinococcus multiflagellatus TaxID=1656887 RepID=A0ABW1ZT77_9DEIO
MNAPATNDVPSAFRVRQTMNSQLQPEAQDQLSRLARDIDAAAAVHEYSLEVSQMAPGVVRVLLARGFEVRHHQRPSGETWTVGWRYPGRITLWQRLRAALAAYRDPAAVGIPQVVTRESPPFAPRAPVARRW